MPVGGRGGERGERSSGAAARLGLRLRAWLAAALLAAFTLAWAPFTRFLPAAAAPPAQTPGTCGAVPLGAVVQLAGTPHLFICAADGLLHWGGDTRALAQQQTTGTPIDWSTRLSYTLAQLVAAPRGDPWLSSGLVKWGDAIGLVKWETGAEPVVLHIVCLGDLAVFGIDASNYGRLVYTPEAWAHAFGRSLP